MIGIGIIIKPILTQIKMMIGNGRKKSNLRMKLITFQVGGGVRLKRNNSK
jgi:hypothetical protein